MRESKKRSRGEREKERVLDKERGIETLSSLSIVRDRIVHCLSNWCWNGFALVLTIERCPRLLWHHLLLYPPGLFLLPHLSRPILLINCRRPRKDWLHRSSVCVWRDIFLSQCVTHLIVPSFPPRHSSANLDPLYRIIFPRVNLGDCQEKGGYKCVRAREREGGIFYPLSDITRHTRRESES